MNSLPNMASHENHNASNLHAFTDTLEFNKSKSGIRPFLSLFFSFKPPLPLAHLPVIVANGAILDYAACLWLAGWLLSCSVDRSYSLIRDSQDDITSRLRHPINKEALSRQYKAQIRSMPHKCPTVPSKYQRSLATYKNTKSCVSRVCSPR